MSYKKMIILAVCTALLISLTACYGRHKDDSASKGDLSPQAGAAVTAKEDHSVLGDYILDPVKNDTGLKYNLLKDGYGGIAIPYPTDSEVKRTASNQIVITDRNDDMTFLIEYVITPQNYGHDGKSLFTADQLVDMFHWQLNEQTFEISGTHYKRGVDQYSETDKGINEINNDGFILLRRDYKELHTVENDMDNDYRIASERRYYISYGDTKMCVSGIGKQAEFEKLKSVVDYMVSNIKEYKEDLAKHTVHVDMENGKSFDLLSVFKEDDPFAKLPYMQAYGPLYIVPDDSGSSLSGSFLFVSRIQDGTHKLTDKSIDGNSVFLYVYPALSGVTENNVITTKLENEQIKYSAGYPLRDALKNKGFKTSDIYESSISVYRTGLGGSYLIEHGDSWIIDTFMASDDSGDYIFTYGYPQVKVLDACKIVDSSSK